MPSIGPRVTSVMMLPSLISGSCVPWIFRKVSKKERQLESLNLESAELMRIAVIAVILLVGLGLLKLTLKLATRVLMLGCLGIVIVLAVMLALGIMS